jgi:hypothetical protein
LSDIVEVVGENFMLVKHKERALDALIRHWHDGIQSAGAMLFGMNFKMLRRAAQMNMLRLALGLPNVSAVSGLAAWLEPRHFILLSRRIVGQVRKSRQPPSLSKPALATARMLGTELGRRRSKWRQLAALLCRRAPICRIAALLLTQVRGGVPEALWKGAVLHADSGVRLLLARFLCDCDVADERALAWAFKKLCADSVGEVRAWAVRSVGEAQRNSRESLDLVLARLDDDDERVREAALCSLFAFPLLDEEAISKLGACLEKVDEIGRHHAAHAMGITSA